MSTNNAIYRPANNRKSRKLKVNGRHTRKRIGRVRRAVIKTRTKPGRIVRKRAEGGYISVIPQVEQSLKN